MEIAFDDGAADAMIAAAETASTVLSDQAGPRRTAAENAAEDFSGGYAKLFTTACAAESADRSGLSSTLSELAREIRAAKKLAQDERDRQSTLSAWEDRESIREQQRAQSGLGRAVDSSGIDDPKPTASPVPPPMISAAFNPRMRTREAQGSAVGGKSSANPSKLKSYVTQATAANNALETRVIDTQNAWAVFSGTCSWVRLGTITFPEGFGRYLTENKADAMWIERVAGQFERAGGGSLSNASLNLGAKSTIVSLLGDKKFMDLIAGKLTPEKAAEYWNSLGLTPEEVKLLPLETKLSLASLDGLPAAVQDIASREFLAFALEKPEEAYTMIGFKDPFQIVQFSRPVRMGNDLTIGEFTARMKSIQAELIQAESDARLLAPQGNPSGPGVQLVGLGTHDGALVAGIVFGNLDTASNVVVNASGMGSDVLDMGDSNRAMQELYRNAQRKNSEATYAAVNWIGYRSPVAVAEVHSMKHAEAGARELAGFLNGIHASRQELGKPTDRINVYAHSYGSTVAVEALKQINFEVDTLATYGSAGVKNGTTRDEIHSHQIYATHAKGDNIAKLGQKGDKSLDPLTMEGVQQFSAEEQKGSGGSTLKRTTMHSMYAEEDKWTFSNMWAGSVGYLSPDSASLDQMGSMLAKGKDK